MNSPRECFFKTLRRPWDNNYNWDFYSEISRGIWLNALYIKYPTATYSSSTACLCVDWDVTSLTVLIINQLINFPVEGNRSSRRKLKTFDVPIRPLLSKCEKITAKTKCAQSDFSWFIPVKIDVFIKLTDLIHGWPGGLRVVPLTTEKTKPSPVFASRGLVTHVRRVPHCWCFLCFEGFSPGTPVFLPL